MRELIGREIQLQTNLCMSVYVYTCIFVYLYIYISADVCTQCSTVETFGRSFCSLSQVAYIILSFVNLCLSFSNLFFFFSDSQVSMALFILLIVDFNSEFISF